MLNKTTYSFLTPDYRFPGRFTSSHSAKRSSVKALLAGMALFFGLSVQAWAAKLDFPADFVLGGYDVVSYFQESGPVMGTREFTMFYDGAFYAFRNAENAEEFRVNTKQYLPAYEANCAFGMVHGMKSSVDPLIWEKVDGRLFFLINAGTRKRWKKRAPGYIEKSDRVWSKLFEE